MTVYDADVIKATESLVGMRTRTTGGAPSKRKRAIHRAIDRGDEEVIIALKIELGYYAMTRQINKDLYK